MDWIGDAGELVRRVRRLAFAGGLPEPLADRLQTVPGVDADVICASAEMLYANRESLDPAALEVVGQLFNYADQQRWTSFNQDGRSAAIVALVRRDLGESGSGVAKAADEWPTATESYVIPADPPVSAEG